MTKTALKLLVVFVEYGEGNCAKFLAATKKIDEDKGHKLFYNIMRVMDEQDGIDSELLGEFSQVSLIWRF